MARSVGAKQARESILKIKADRRVPMMTVYALYSGQAKPQDVLDAARAGNPPAGDLKAQLFYAHLYVGLYYEAEGDSQRALEHLATAVEKHKVGHYMWNVARVHADLLRKAAKK
jgi:lipoprotein NlpI